MSSEASMDSLSSSGRLARMLSGPPGAMDAAARHVEHGAMAAVERPSPPGKDAPAKRGGGVPSLRERRAVVQRVVASPRAPLFKPRVRRGEGGIRTLSSTRRKEKTKQKKARRASTVLKDLVQVALQGIERSSMESLEEGNEEGDEDVYVPLSEHKYRGDFVEKLESLSLDSTKNIALGLFQSLCQYKSLLTATAEIQVRKGKWPKRNVAAAAQGSPGARMGRDRGKG